MRNQETEKKLHNLLKSINLVDFKKPELLIEAFTHRSYLNEFRNTDIQHNERLEFLGDAVLELVVTEYLFSTYADFKEGDLTSFRAALVKTESLALEAKKLNLGEYILMSKGEESTGGRNRPYILANTMEAFIGSIYLSEGYETASKFILKHIGYKAKEIIEERLDIDAKSKLQEIAQEAAKITPSYKLLGSSGPDHNKTFEMAVTIGEHEFGKGTGKSKQDAEQAAANQALEKWDKLFKKHFNRN
jgi:ribonuclease-3